jgi:hypothetical protein
MNDICGQKSYRIRVKRYGISDQCLLTYWASAKVSGGRKWALVVRR